MQSFKNYLTENEVKFNVECVAGPIWSEDYHDPEVGNDLVGEEFFLYVCTLNGNKILVGEEPEDKFRFIAWASTNTYKLYTKSKQKIMPLLEKAIEKYELKKHISKDTNKSFGGLIDVI